MVEKIIVNPEEIRGLGNIVSSNHSLEDYKVYMSTLEEGTAEIEGVETVVYEMDPLGSDISIALTLSASTISIGGTVTVTATVTEDESPVSGVSVSFKQGDTVLGSSTTNSSGVATYTYTGAEVGTYTIRATYNNVYSNAETLLVDKVNTTTTFTANPTVITVLNDTLLTATVLDENSNPVVNEYVEFYVYYGGRSIALAPGQTDSNGVATYSYHTNRTGEMEVYAVFLNCTNYNRSESNHVPISVESHTYSLEFSESSYTATGGSCTVSVLLEKDSAPLADAVVTFSSDESTTVTATTGSDGVASATISFNDSTTLLASYNNITDTAEITVVPAYLLSDDASVDNSSTLFGNSIALRNGANTTSWDGSGYYKITNTGSQKESMRVLAPLDGVTDDFVIEYDSYVQQTGGSSGFVIYNSSTAWVKLTDDADGQKKYWYGYNDGTFHETAFYGNTTTYQKWVHYKFTVQGTTFKMEVTYNDSTVVTRTETIHFNRSSSTQYGLDCEWQQNTVTRYKNLIAYRI